jgi:hypothetical protein
VLLWGSSWGYEAEGGGLRWDRYPEPQFFFFLKTCCMIDGLSRRKKCDSVFVPHVVIQDRGGPRREK